MSFPSIAPTFAIIIGGGFSGLTMACRLQDSYGLDDYCIYDRLDGIGGTWLKSTYPGSAVDIPGICYSLSFAPNPNFTQLFPSQREILAYITQIATEYGVYDHFKGRTEWRGAEWQESSRTWLVTFEELSTGQLFTQECKVLISGVGGLVNPNNLDVPGMEDFDGEIIHTSQWKEGLDLSNKHVVVVGNGASAVQLIPAIVDDAKTITQLMRVSSMSPVPQPLPDDKQSPHYIMPRKSYRIPPVLRTVFRLCQGILWLARIAMFIYIEMAFFQFNTDWFGSWARKSSAKTSKDYIRDRAPEKYWSLLMPTYEFGCKRRVFDHSYLDCLHLDNVQLISDDIVSLKPKSVVTRFGSEFTADIIILATGYTPTQWDTELRGRNGKTRKQHWDAYQCKEAFETVAMNGFPNFFYILGPNSGRAHTSILLSMENYVEFIISLIKPIITNRCSAVEVKAESERKYNTRLHNALGQTVYNTSCSSFFIDKATGTNWFIYPWNSVRLWLATHWDFSDDWVYYI